MANGNEHEGPSSRLRKPDAWYFERLPPTARHALAAAMFDWSSGYFYVRWKRGVKGFKTGADIAVQVARADQDVLHREARKAAKREKP